MRCICLLCCALLLMLTTPGNARGVEILSKNAKINLVGVRPHRDTKCMMERGWEYSGHGELGDYFQFSATTLYRIELKVKRKFSGADFCGLFLDGYLVETATLDQKRRKYYFQTKIPEGIHRVTFSFILHKAIKNTDGLRPDTESGVNQDTASLAKNGYAQSLGGYISRITIVPAKSGTGVAKPQLTTKSAWIEDCKIREQQALKLAAEGAEKYRKGNLNCTILDADGRLATDVAVAAEQVSHEFLFGANIFRFNDFKTDEERGKYRDMFARIFNLATTWMYWNSYEGEEGKPRYWETESVAKWAVPRGIKVKGHPVLWDFPINPPWIKGRPTEEQQVRRVKQLLTRFKGKVSLWDIVNEFGHGSRIPLDLPHKTARETDPQAVLVVNENAILGNGFKEFGLKLKSAVERGVPFDAIGIQGHEPPMSRFPLDQIQRYLDLYSVFGKDLHITEFEVPSEGQEVAGFYEDAKWDEDFQEKYVIEFFRICFGHPSVKAIGYWDFCDAGSWLKGGGLIRKDLTPKKAYLALDKLINKEFRTSLKGKTNDKGEFHFRGFGGEYNLMFSVGDKTFTKKIVLKSGEENTVTISLAENPPAGNVD